MTIYVPPGGGFPPTILTGNTINAGNLGSTYTVNFTSAANTVEYVTGTLNANCTITFSNRAAGCQAYLFLSQDGTGGRTLSISDGTSSSVISIPPAANAFFVVEVFCPDVTNVDVLPVLGGPLPNSVVGASRFLSPSGSDDSVAAAAAIAAGGTIVLGPGTFLWNTSFPAFTRSTPTRVTGSGIGKTTIKLSTAVSSAFEFHKVADYDTFNDIEISDLTIDCNNINDYRHVVLGTYSPVSGQASPTRINLNGIRIRRVKTINVPNNMVGVATGNRMSVALTSYHGAANEGTQTSVQHVLLEDCDFVGGDTGFLIAGAATNGNQTCNVFLDDIVCTRVRHDTTTLPTKDTAGGNQIGGGAKVQTVRLYGCHSANSGDIGFEIDGVQDFIGEDCTVVDAWATRFLNLNYQAPNNVQEQRNLWRGCAARTVSLDNPPTGRADFGTALLSGAYTPVAFGELALESCSTDYRSALSAPPALSSGSAIAVLNAPMAKLRIRDHTISYSALSTNASANTFEPVAIQSSTSGAIYDIDGIRFVMNGTRNGVSAMTWHQMIIRSPATTTPATFLCRNYQIDIAGFASTANDVFLWIFPSTSKLHMEVDGVHVLTPTTGQQNIVFFGSTMTYVGQPLIRRLDTNNATSGNGFDVGGTVAANLYIKDTISVRTQGSGSGPLQNPTAITPGASPYTYQNLDNLSEQVIVSGGTVSAVQYSRDNSTFFSLPIAGVCELEPADFLKVTYTVAPTMTKVPAKA